MFVMVIVHISIAKALVVQSISGWLTRETNKSHIIESSQ